MRVKVRKIKVRIAECSKILGRKKMIKQGGGYRPESLLETKTLLPVVVVSPWHNSAHRNQQSWSTAVCR